MKKEMGLNLKKNIIRSEKLVGTRNRSKSDGHPVSRLIAQNRLVQVLELK